MTIRRSAGMEHAACLVDGDDAIVGLDVPPAPRGRIAARRLGRRIAGEAKAAPAGTRFGLRLAPAQDLRRPVAVANAVLGAWPAGRPLEYVHVPFAVPGDGGPPPLAPHRYAPLAALKLPATTRFVAGLAHPDQPLADQRFLLDVVDRLVGMRAGVAACGGVADAAASERVRALAAG